MNNRKAESTTVDAEDLYLMDDCSYEYQDKPFTGIARQHNREGRIVSEIEYVNGLQSGLSRYWYPSGELMGEEHFLRNSRSGTSKEWYPNGKLKRDTVFEHAIRTREQRWNENGELCLNFVLTQDNPLFSTLVKLRQAFGP